VLINKANILALSLFGCLISFSGCGSRVYTESKLVMGTVARISVVANQSRADRVLELAFEEIKRIEQKFSPYLQESEVSQLNSEGSLSPSSETVWVISESLKYSELTKGKFDITVYPIIKIWDIKRREIPAEKDIKKALKNVGYRKIRIDDGLVSLNGTSLDLGGIVKGYAVDRVCGILKKNGITRALIDIGGDIYAMGDREGKGWSIGVQHPRKENRLIGILQFEDRAVVTSGDYRRYFISGGRRYHHIIDPQTGYPAEGCQSVTIVASSTMKADALSTGIFVLGPEEGMKLVNSLDGVEVVIVDSKGKLIYSDGVKDIFEEHY